MELDFDVPLCGRGDELRRLEEILASPNDPQQGPIALSLQGVAGTGKTSIVDELCERNANKYIFLRGKFEDGVQQQPLEAWRQVLLQCIPHLRPSPEEGNALDFDTLTRSKLRALTMIAPEVLKAIERVSPDEMSACASNATRLALKRVCLAVRALIDKLSTHKKVVICLDDLQWGSKTSRILLTNVLEDTSLHSLVVLGTQRPYEDPSARFSVMEIQDLSLEYVIEYVRRLLKCDDVGELGKLVYDRTHGNAFFVVQFVRHLCDFGLLCYDVTALTWKYKLSDIQASTTVTPNVVDLLVSKLKTLPAPHLKAISHTAALSAPTFHPLFVLFVLNEPMHGSSSGGDSSATSSIHNERITAQELRAFFATATHQGLLLHDAQEQVYRFAHDRIREAALQCLPPKGSSDRLEVHLRFGKVLTILSRIANPSTSQSFFNKDQLILLAMDHFCVASAVVVDPNEKIEMARNLVEASSIACEQCAFTSALRYLEVASMMLPKSRWLRHQHVTSRIYSDLSRVYFCLGQVQESTKAAQEVLQFSMSLVDKLPAYRQQADNLLQLRCSQAAVDMCSSVVKELGYALPTKGFLSSRTMPSIQKLLKKAEKMGDLELMQHKSTGGLRIKWAYEFLEKLAQIGIATYNFDVVLAATSCTASLLMDHGNIRCPGELCHYLGFFAGVCKQRTSTYRFFRLATVAQDVRSTEDRDAASAMVFKLAYLSHWFEPAQDLLSPLIACHEHLLERGDMSNFSNSVLIYTHTYFLCGLSLEPIVEDAKGMHSVLESLGQDHSLALYRPFLQMISNLSMDVERDPTELSGQYMHQREFMDEYALDKRVVHQVYQCLLYLYVLFGRYEQAIEASRHLVAEEGPVVWLPFTRFMEMMAHFGLARTKRRHLGKAKALLKKLERYLTNGNPNAIHLVLLGRAELAALCGVTSCQRLYDDAIVACAKAGILHVRALANECAARYFAGTDKDWSTVYWQRAHSLWLRWSANAKVHQLEEEHPDIFSELHHDAAQPSSPKSSERGILAKSKLKKLVASAAFSDAASDIAGMTLAA